MAASKQQPKKRILIVDDDTEALELYSALLGAAGYQVDQAEHALAAVAAVVRNAPDLIISDIRMPIVDGMGLAHELKSHIDSRVIPVVALTGYDDPGTREAALKAGYDDYLTKPVDAKKFPSQIAELIKKHGKGKGGK
ncbi:MAG: response regulator [Verrucomicrobia bacterium]|nr:MAG: response regulator [Verrucomicrobiota bacterium]